MKKLKSFLVGLLLLCFFPTSVHAASGTIKVSGAGTAIVGNQVKVTVTLSSSTAIGSWNLNLNYDKNYLSLVNSSAEAGGTKMVNSSSGVKAKSYTFTFKALKSGSTSISVGSYEAFASNDMSELSLTTSSLKIKIMTQEELEATYSKDNTLKSLSVEGYTLSPAFSKDTLEYKVSVPTDVTKVSIAAVKNDASASLVGDGEKDVVEGNNRFEIVVTAQNGSEKKYVVNVEVEDLQPISLKIEDKDYTIVKRKDILEIPTGYEETKITIDNATIPAFKSEISGFTLVGVKDSDGKISLAIYNEDTKTYTLYYEFKSNSLSLYLVDFPNELKGYLKRTTAINGVDVQTYKYKESSRFVICYGMNLDTGKYEYYSYDTVENAFQIWNDEEIKDLEKDLKLYTFVSLGLGGALFVSFLFIVVLLAKRNKKIKKKIKNKIESKFQDVEVFNQENEDEDYEEDTRDKLDLFDRFDMDEEK